MTPAPLYRRQHALDRAHHSVELGALGGQLFPSGSRELVIAGASVVLRGAPLGLYPAVDQEALQRGIQRALSDSQDIVRGQAQVLDDAVAVFRAADERLQD